MSKPHWFPFYPNDFLSSSKVALMTNEERGGYILLLCHEWNDPQCSLPDDDVAVRKLSQLIGDLELVKSCFIRKRGRLVNERLHNEWIKAKEHKELSSLHGKQGAMKRWMATPLATPLATPSQNYSSSPSPLPSPLSSSSSSSSESESEKEVKTSREVRKPSRVVNGDAVSTKSWEAYSQAYHSRYHVLPPRNQKVNSGLCQLVRDIGSEDAPLVARFYLSHPGRFYAENLHPINLLVRDSQKLLTEYKTGTVMTATQARHDDGRAARGQMWQRLIDKDANTKKEGT